MRIKTGWLGFVFSGLLLAAGLACAQEFSWYDGSWPQEKSAVKPAPEVVYGRLANGFRWAYIPSTNPRDRLSVYLDVQAGSLMETPEQYGLAHYLEHMAFNGSTNYPPDSLIPWFQSQGMSFGGDTNAHTSLNETVYKLNLVDAKPETLKNGLSILRDFADQMTLTKHEVDEERGIILAEKKVRDNVYVKQYFNIRSFLYPDNHLGESVIGHEKTIKGATPEILREYYRKWYRPERMVLVVSGQIDPKRLEKAVEEAFGSMKGEGPLPYVESFGKEGEPGLEGLTQVNPSDTVTISYIQRFPTHHVPMTDKSIHADFVDEAVMRLFDRRLEARLQLDPTLWKEAGFVTDARGGLSPTSEFTIVTDKARFRTSLAMMKSVLRTIKQRGFTKTELDAVLANMEHAYEDAVYEGERLTSREKISAFIDATNAGEVYLSPEQMLERFRAFKKSVKLDEVNAALRFSLSSPVERITYIGPEPLTNNAFVKLWRKTPGVLLEVQSAGKVKFPYLEKPAAVSTPVVKSQAVETPWGVKTISRMRLANGVDVVMMPVPEDRDHIEASLFFGDGISGLIDRQAPLAKTAYGVLASGGLGHLTPQQTYDTFTSKGIRIAELLGENYAELSGSASVKQAPELFEAMRTAFLDPVLTENARQRFLEKVKLAEAVREDTVGSVVANYRNAFFSGLRGRSMPLTVEEAGSYKLDEMKSYIASTRIMGGKLLVVTGDIDPVALAKHLSDVFSALPRSRTSAILLGLPPAFPKASAEHFVKRDRLGKASVTMGWHLDAKGPKATEQRFMGDVLAMVVSERLRKVVREEKQLAYSPRARYFTTPLDEGHGVLEAIVDTDADKRHEVVKLVNSIARDLAAHPVPKEELDRLLKTKASAWKTSGTSPRPWHNELVSDLLLKRAPLKAYSEEGERIARVTPEALQRFARRVFDEPSVDFVVYGGEGEARPDRGNWIDRHTPSLRLR